MGRGEVCGGGGGGFKGSDEKREMEREMADLINGQ